MLAGEVYFVHKGNHICECRFLFIHYLASCVSHVRSPRGNLRVHVLSTAL